MDEKPTILIVGKGNARGEWGRMTTRLFDFDYVSSAKTTNGEIVAIDKYYLVFQHTGSFNPEAKDTAIAWTGKLHKVVYFGGGNLAPEWIPRFPGATWVSFAFEAKQFVSWRWALLREIAWSNAPDALAILRGVDDDMLAAIHILCTGAKRHLGRSDRIPPGYWRAKFFSKHGEAIDRAKMIFERFCGKDSNRIWDKLNNSDLRAGNEPSNDDLDAMLAGIKKCMGETVTVSS